MNKVNQDNDLTIILRANDSILPVAQQIRRINSENELLKRHII